jgi:hypothetical protein
MMMMMMMMMILLYVIDGECYGQREKYQRTKGKTL